MKQQKENQPWEEICQRCGECCFEKKIDQRGNIRTTSIPCRFLDIHTRNCLIYQQRQQAEADCIKLTPHNLPELDWLPENCAYRRFVS